MNIGAALTVGGGTARPGLDFGVAARVARPGIVGIYVGADLLRALAEHRRKRKLQVVPAAVAEWLRTAPLIALPQAA